MKFRKNLENKGKAFWEEGIMVNSLESDPETVAGRFRTRAQSDGRQTGSGIVEVARD